MAKMCQLTGKTAMVGHKVSFSNKKYKRRFYPNLIKMKALKVAKEKGYYKG